MWEEDSEEEYVGFRGPSPVTVAFDFDYPVVDEDSDDSDSTVFNPNWMDWLYRNQQGVWLNPGDAEAYYPHLDPNYGREVQTQDDEDEDEDLLMPDHISERYMEAIGIEAMLDWADTESGRKRGVDEMEPAIDMPVIKRYRPDDILDFDDDDEYL